MAIYHLHVQVISRGQGRTSTCCAAYRTGKRIHDDRNGLTHDYRVKGRGVISSFIELPEGAPSRFFETSALWNGAEAAARQKNGQTAREADVALAHELTPAQQERTLRRLAQYLVDRYNVGVEVSIHKPDRQGDGRNQHAHLMWTMHEILPEGFAKKKIEILDRGEQRKAEFLLLRKKWETIVNDELEAAGFDARVSRASNQARNIPLPPQIHEGVASRAMHRRGKEIRESRNVVDFKGRETNYEKIDNGASRAEYNAEIINLQQYKDTQQERLERQQIELHEEEIIEQKIVGLEARAGELYGDIAALQGMLNEALLSEDLMAKIRVALERAITAIFHRQHETEYLQARAAAKRQEEEIAHKQRELHRITRQIEELQEQRQQIEAQYAANRELYSKILLMPAMLGGIPAYVIKLEVPLSQQFNEVAYQGALQKQDTAQLLKAVLSPPTIPAKPALATVALRQDVLQVKELLARAKPGGEEAGAVKHSAAGLGATLRGKGQG